MNGGYCIRRIKDDNIKYNCIIKYDSNVITSDVKLLFIYMYITR